MLAVSSVLSHPYLKDYHAVQMTVVKHHVLGSVEDLVPGHGFLTGIC